MLAIGFDFGLKYIGVAIGQTITMTANALCTLKAKNGIPDWDEIDKLLAEWQPQALVVGIPGKMEGEDQINISKKAENFAKKLQRFNLPIYTIDERLTTKEARQQLFDARGYRALKKSAVDSFAAKLIVESWLREQR